MLLETAENPDAWEDIESNWKKYLAKSPLVQNPENLSKDGWGKEYQIEILEQDGEQVILIRSEKFESYKRNYPDKFRD